MTINWIMFYFILALKLLGKKKTPSRPWNFWKTDVNHLFFTWPYQYKYYDIFPSYVCLTDIYFSPCLHACITDTIYIWKYCLLVCMIIGKVYDLISHCRACLGAYDWYELKPIWEQEEEMKLRENNLKITKRGRNTVSK